MAAAELAISQVGYGLQMGRRVQILSAASATPGPWVGVPPKTFGSMELAVDIEVTGAGSMSALTINLEGTLDPTDANPNTHVILAMNGTSDAAYGPMDIGPFSHIRLNIATYTPSSGTPTIVGAVRTR